MWRRRAGTTLVAMLGIVVALGLAEVGLRVVGFGDPVLYDNRAAWGYRPLPDQTRRRFGGARVHVNGLGTRGPDVGREPRDGARRVLFLGDSVTFGGTYVDDDALFSAVAAAAQHVPVEPLDAGVNAWGFENVLGLVQATGGFASDVWVLTALEDDFRREKTHIGEVPYFNVAPKTALAEVAVLAAYQLLGRYRVPKPENDIVALGRRNLSTVAAIVAAARTAGAKILLVWHPYEGALRWGQPEPNRAPYLAIDADARLDLHEAYGRASAPLYVDGMHLSVEGHRVAGEAIGTALAPILASLR
ncbi:MAG TPA: hypothetical protein VGR62_00665 [Candidatus Binatia bacterium]|nr:hypothetical protein [Candidatus Binatia bacterium]